MLTVSHGRGLFLFWPAWLRRPGSDRSVRDEQVEKLTKAVNNMQAALSAPVMTRCNLPSTLGGSAGSGCWCTERVSRRFHLPPPSVLAYEEHGTASRDNRGQHVNTL